MSLRDVQTIHVSNMLARDLVILLASAAKMVKTYCLVYKLTCTFLEGENLKNASYYQELRCFYKSHPGTVQIGSSLLANTVERKN